MKYKNELTELNKIVDRASMKVGGIEKYEYMQFGKDGIYFDYNKLNAPQVEPQRKTAV